MNSDIIHEKKFEERDLIIEKLKKDIIQKDNKIVSDTKIINNYITERSELSKKNALLNLEVASYKRKIDEIQIENSQLLKEKEESLKNISLHNQKITKLKSEKNKLDQELQTTKNYYEEEIALLGSVNEI